MTHFLLNPLRKSFLPALTVTLLFALSSCGSSHSYWGIDGRTPDGNVYYTVGSDSRSPGYHRAPPPPPHQSKKEMKRWKKAEKKRMKAIKKQEKERRKHNHHRHH